MSKTENQCVGLFFCDKGNAETPKAAGIVVSEEPRPDGKNLNVVFLSADCVSGGVAREWRAPGDVNLMDCSDFDLHRMEWRWVQSAIKSLEGFLDKDASNTRSTIRRILAGVMGSTATVRAS